MPNSIDVSKPLAAGLSHGSLTVVGTGIRSIAHMTQEAVGHIREADAVFYSVPDGVTAAFIRDLNPSAYNLSLHYGEDKRRLVTYVQMAEMILREVRKGLRVVAVFYGHPGFFVSPARRALTIARKEGHHTEMLPGISSTDYLFSDLRIDPSAHGCQILDATDMLLRDRPVVTSGHVVLLQVGSVGDSYYSVKGFKNNKRDILFRRLIEIYGEDHPAYHYVGASFPGLQSQIIRRPLKAYLDPKVRASVHPACSFYFPPKEYLPLNEEMAEQLGMGSILPAAPTRRSGDYGPFELDAVARLDREAPGGRERTTSAPLYRILNEIAVNPLSMEAFQRNPLDYVSQFPGLTDDEKSALIGQSSGALHRVSAQIIYPVAAAATPAPTEHNDAQEHNDPAEHNDAQEHNDPAEHNDAQEHNDPAEHNDAQEHNDPAEHNDAQEHNDPAEHNDAQEHNDPAEHNDAQEHNDPAEHNDAQEHNDPAEHNDAQEHNDPSEHNDALEHNDPAEHNDALEHNDPSEHNDALEHNDPAEHNDALEHNDPSEHNDALEHNDPAEDR